MVNKTISPPDAHFFMALKTLEGLHYDGVDFTNEECQLIVNLGEKFLENNPDVFPEDMKQPCLDALINYFNIQKE